MCKFINITKSVLLGKDVEIMLQRIEKIWSEKGQGIVEYALILAFVVAIAIVALKSDSGIGKSIQNLFTNTGAQIENAGKNVGGNAE
jgi:pilus assembly protein Flp/PilA